MNYETLAQRRERGINEQMHAVQHQLFMAAATRLHDELKGETIADVLFEVTDRFDVPSIQIRFASGRTVVIGSSSDDPFMFPGYLEVKE